MKTLATASAIILAASVMHAETREAAIASLVAAERGFAQACLDTGYKASFLGVLAADSTVYQPGPVNGREAVSSGEDPAMVLVWYPAVADISASGDIGFTTGPYTATPKNPGEKWRGTGHYTSVWRRNADGKWELLVDLGTPHPETAEPIPAWQPVSGQTPLAPTVDAAEREARRTALLACDTALGKPADGETYASALKRFAEPDALIYRRGNPPFAGLEAAAANEHFASEVVTSTSDTAAVSKAGDWGYTLGAMTIKTGGDSRDAHYLRLWHRSAADGEWRLFLDTFAPMPRPKPAN